MKELALIFHSDPGHGWLAVKVKLLDKLGLIDKITVFSYLRGKTAYLEEDLDAGTFMSAAKDAGIKVNIKQSYAEKTPIRYYQPYSADIAREAQNER
jgi:ABC-type transport system substrate-binding protein